MTACDNCGKTGVELQRCGRCRGAAYCGRSCQAQDWRKGHRYLCRAAAPSGPGALHETEVREALKAAEEEEPEVRTDADNVGAEIRATPLRRHDAEVKVVAEADPEPAAEEAGEGAVAAARRAAGAAGADAGAAAAAGAQQRAEEDSDDEPGEFVDSCTGADSVDAVEPFKLDPDFDYDRVQLSTPEFPYNMRPR
eukprot:TRINITY_DN12040_c0_g1_i1.p2 TRINITY_DN12040_c0_g1~~TRINITY_DN12040_c0_g1_i1.p2  ORF type:complete len:195 (-),score=45.26 TRINITY_DN12040_c0_g1_i1:361-945(-)